MKTNKMIYVVVFCIGWAVLAFELLQTRVLSALYYNNIVYLTVTVALMGFGISGVFVSIIMKRIKNPEKLACFSVGLFSLLAIVCIRVVSFMPVVLPGTSTLSKLIVSYFILTIPFLFAGCALGLIFMIHGKNIYRLYFIDLAACALGAFCFTFLLRPLGADMLLWITVAVALLGFIMYSKTAGLNRLYPVIFSVLFLLGFTLWGKNLVNTVPVSIKMAAQLQYQNAHIESTMWTTIAKIDIWSEGNHFLGLKTLTQDGCAPAAFPSEKYRKNILENQTDPQATLTPQSLPYLINPEPEDVLVIGPGGGQEIVLANVFGAKHIDAAEINPATCEFALGKYRDFLSWPTWNNVSLNVAEGRHFVSRTDKQYDVISMTGVDTFSALNAGAYVLSENYLYTVEAIESYLNSLKPNGTMFICRLMFDYPREALRLANIFLYGAERMGIDDPSQCILVVGWLFAPTSWGATLIKKEPFTPEEIETILSRIDGQPDLGAVYIPDVFPKEKQEKIESEAFLHLSGEMKTARDAYYGLIRAETISDRKAFEREYRYNISPVTDDRPFFFEYHKVNEIFKDYETKDFWSRGTIVHYVLFFLFGLTALISFLAMILPLYFFEREGLHINNIWPLHGFFASLGVGFMFIEIGLIQRLSIYLGHPMYSLAVVLSGILLFTGIGSYVAGTQQVKTDRKTLLKRGMLGTAITTFAWLVIMKYVFPATLGWPLWTRIIITLLSTLPIGLFMGIPFATGLRYLEEHYPRFIPWAWGINGLTSVMGSVLAILLAMRIGFSSVIILGCLIYLCGLISVLRHLRGGWKISA